MPVVLSSTRDPYANAALESLLFERAAERGPFLFLYINRASVVLGRHQNPWVECNMAALARDAVPLVRRISGGGTVYHDPGNLNFSFMSSADAYNLDAQFALVIAALTQRGVNAARNERNDLVADTRKFSGNAFRHSRGNSLHHGTLLVGSDLSRLTRYLAAPEARIQTKAIASVRSTVVNLSELAPGLTPETVQEELSHQYALHHDDPVLVTAPGGEPGVQPHPELPEWFPTAAGVHAERDRLAGWEWLFGHTPAFSRTYHDAGGATLELTVSKGVVTEAVVTTAGGRPRGMDELVGRRLNRKTAALLERYDWATGLARTMMEDLW